MIFVTVGTHEQQFDRLIKYVDELDLPEEVMIQRGYSDYIPRNCRAEKLLPYEKMKQYTERARIVITHGGPSSIMMPLQMGKIPIVVPRQKKFGEHVNDHQVEFVQKISGTTDIIPVYDIEKLGDIIRDYDRIASGSAEVKSNNARFNRRLEEIVEARPMRHSVYLIN